MTQHPNASLTLGKINIQPFNNYPTQGLGELGSDPAERTTESVVDPYNLIQVILAEGKT